MSKVEGHGIALKGVINQTFLVILKNKILLQFKEIRGQVQYENNIKKRKITTTRPNIETKFLKPKPL